MDACTVTAPDVITAFAVPNPNYSSQNRRFFQVRPLNKLPCQAHYPVYFGLTIFIRQPFQPSTEATLTERPEKSTQTFGAILYLRAVHNVEGNSLHCLFLLISMGKEDEFCTAASTTGRTRPIEENEPKNRLDVRDKSEHLADSRHSLMWDLIAYVDGGSRGNPGPSGIGVVIDGCASGPIRIAKWIGNQDNNVAEYVALMEALQCALALKARALHVFSDSQVVVRQMTGEYTCRSPRLYSLHWMCRKLARSLKFSISHVPRERNAEANRLAGSVIRRRRRS